MTIQEFSGLKKKELNTTYSVEVDGVTKLVELIDSKREEKKENSKNCKTLYLAKVDGVSYEDYFNITDLCNKIVGKNVGSRKGNGNKGNGNKKSNKPLTKEELSDRVKLHIDALQNAYTNFYNLLVGWNIDTANINFANFNSSKHFVSVAKKCISDNNELKKAQIETAQEDVKKTLQNTGLSKAELLAMLADMKD